MALVVASDASAIKKQFRSLDKDHNGGLDFQEMYDLLRRGDPTMRSNEIKALFKAVDKDGSGKIEFDEFVDYVHTGQGSRQGSRRPSKSSEPGPGDYQLAEARRHVDRKAPVATFGTGPGHEGIVREPSPGPTDYNDGSQRRGFERNAPVATIGRGPGHSAALRERSPGPGDYGVERADRRISSSRSSPCVSIGMGPGHESRARADSPGPASYNAHEAAFRRASIGRAPTATFGRGPGHEGPIKPSSAPGPGSYQFAQTHHVPGGSYFTTALRQRAGAGVRKQFRRIDVNHDGRLDFEELRALLRQGDPGISDRAVRVLFNNADRNSDGRISFEELIDYVGTARSVSSNRSLSNLKAALTSTDPGPGAYRAEKSYHVRGGGFSKAPR